jgi:uncharacterized metal-binding protein
MDQLRAGGGELLRHSRGVMAIDGCAIHIAAHQANHRAGLKIDRWDNGEMVEA